ncbi:lantibiotic dehydratase C-terminal domain-containing protein [Saccharothrix sp.]|uniref:lantibiotic dehydratase C-terminal domain-containing protein n=1 Tax=Saccharothrix sp. TaxID=1873460 RepID=UPI0028126AD8|nr:lantibiotic dehydratase C-terminal domain-containing protein [Saccharothrix sp.]
MAEPTWIAAHVFHRGDQDLLVSHAMAPLCAELLHCGQIDDWFFLRYWEGGPHVRLRLRVTGNVQEVRTAVADTCARHLTDHPSPPDTWTQERYQAIARHRAAAEPMTRWQRRLRPVDTVEFTAYRPEHRTYGTGIALRAVERHFTDSSRIAAALLTTPRDRRAAVALAMLTLTTAVCEPDLARASARFTTTTQLPERYRDQARLLWSHASRNPAPTDPLAVWLHSIRAVHTTLTALRETGGFAPDDVLSRFAGLARALCPDDPLVPCVVLRCAHLLCNRLGLSAATEARLVDLTTASLSALHDEVAPP